MNEFQVHDDPEPRHRRVRRELARDILLAILAKSFEVEGAAKSRITIRPASQDAALAAVAYADALLAELRKP